MKMAPQMFESLAADLRTYWTALGRGPCSMRDQWEALHRVMEDKTNDDSHPFYVRGERKRIFPFVGRRAGIDTFYDAGLNDSHIETALRKIMAQ